MTTDLLVLDSRLLLSRGRASTVPRRMIKEGHDGDDVAGNLEVVP